MNLDHNALARTGRTTSMLTHAVERARLGLYSIVLGHNAVHVPALRNQTEPLLPEDKEERERLGSFIRYGVLSRRLRENNYGRTRFYDYGSHSFRHEAPADQLEVLVDHHALERQLATVIRYLRAAQQLTDDCQWLIDSARMLSATGRRVYLVTQDEHILGEAKVELTGYNVSVEGPETLSNLNLVDLTLVGAHPSVVLLVDPVMLESKFRGALVEINRWDAK